MDDARPRHLGTLGATGQADFGCRRSVPCTVHLFIQTHSPVRTECDLNVETGGKRTVATMCGSVTTSQGQPFDGGNATDFELLYFYCQRPVSLGLSPKRRRKSFEK